MKRLLSILAAIILCMTVATAQQKVSFSKTTEIPASKIQTSVKNNKTVQFVNLQTLKPGHNFMRLKTGDILYVEFKDQKIVSYTLTNAKGIVQGKPVIITPTVQFQCSQKFCICSGDADCNDMFTTNVCGPDAVCFGNQCVCYR